MSNDIEKILVNLGVLAALKQNDKLLTEGEHFAIYIPTVLRGAVRMYYRESRELNVRRIGECIDRAKGSVSAILSEHTQVTPSDAQIIAEDGKESIQMRLYRRTQMQQCTRLLHAMAEINTGLDNLVETYRDDAGLVVRLRNIKDDVNDFVDITQYVGRTSPIIHRLQEE